MRFAETYCQSRKNGLLYRYTVAPRTGAWIEIQNQTDSFSDIPVAPRTGAWIEIVHNALTVTMPCSSHPARVRGLKFRKVIIPILYIVAPRTGAWIEIPGPSLVATMQKSRTPHGCVD